MLRVSAHAVGHEIDLRSVADRTVTPVDPIDAALYRFTDALIDRTDDLDTTRSTLLDLIGPSGVVAAAAAAGNFEQMNRLVDATGLPITAERWATAPTIGLDLDGRSGS